MNHTENSSRCGKGNCVHYNKHNLDSKCKIHNNRNECNLSLSHKKKVTKKSITYNKSHNNM